MASLIEKLTAQGGGESAGFLNEMVAMLWPNINVALSKIIKEAVEPVIKSSLPSPLSGLHFIKLDLGPVPLQLSNVRSSKTEDGGIDLGLNVDWAGRCDIELDGDMVPAVGVESVQLHGRLSILLSPLTNVIPLIGAVQVSFINPPVLNLDFTGAANIADFSLLHDTVHDVLLGIINGMFTLPNRFLVKLDINNDYFKTYTYPYGILRVTVEKAWGFADEAKGTASKLFAKLTRSAPDAYAKVDLGAEEQWQTSTKNNTTSPKWDETRDFVVCDFDQCIKVDLYDHDVNAADQIGLGVTTVREILLASNKQELGLVLNGEETKGKVSLTCEYFELVADASSFTNSDHKGDGRVCGIATVLIAGAFGIKGKRQELKPSVVVTWGEKHRFQTTVVTDYPGIDVSNPAFDQAFRIPITTEAASGTPSAFHLALMNGESEIGSIDVPFADVLNAANMIHQEYFDVKDGQAIRASICLRGIKSGTLQKAALTERTK